MEDQKNELLQLKKQLEDTDQKLDIKSKRRQVEILESKTGDPEFWQGSNAKKIMQELSDTKEQISLVDDLHQQISSLEEFIDMAEKEDIEAVKADVIIQLQKLQSQYQKLEISLFLTGEYDSSNALLSVHSGQGGTEAMDWAEMLLRMYTRFVEKNGWKYELINQSRGEEAGIKSATILVQGKRSYGLLKNEQGTHRLVRQSPFNADNLRQTSFALVEILPEIQADSDIEVKDEDLEWSFTRSSGKGGQNVNKVNTAVRLKHLPGNIIVECQAQRTQVQNRALALGLLKAKLWEKKQLEDQERLESIKGKHHPATWGTQIRSYVLHPYHLIKDNRTQIESTDTAAVLDGDLEKFIEAEIKLS